jgi:hypothetical protein
MESSMFSGLGTMFNILIGLAIAGVVAIIGGIGWGIYLLVR